MFLFSYFLCFLCFSSYASDSLDEEKFYIFGVGQGNSQLAVYGKNRIGVLYDCGSTSSMTEMKLANIAKGGKTNHFFIDRSFQHQEEIRKSNMSQSPLEFGFSADKEQSFFIQSVHFDSNDDVHMEDSQIHQNNQSFFIQSEKPLDFTNIHPISISFEEIEKHIHNIIDSHKLKHLFIILSHPDTDHIRFINHKTIPTDLPVTAILGGDWLGEGGSNTAGNGLSKTVKTVLHFLNNRSNTYTNLPYYWGFQSKQINGEAKNEYEDLFRYFNSSLNAEIEKDFNYYYKLLSKEGRPINSDQFFGGTLVSFLKNIKERVPYIGFGFQYHFNEDHLDFNSDEFSDLQKVTIHLMNQRFEDVNDQSIVVSFKMPELKMQFVCTGDATPSVLKKIKTTF